MTTIIEPGPRWTNPTSIEALHAGNRVRTEHAALHTCLLYTSPSPRD